MYYAVHPQVVTPSADFFSSENSSSKVWPLKQPDKHGSQASFVSVLQGNHIQAFDDNVRSLSNIMICYSARQDLSQWKISCSLL